MASNAPSIKAVPWRGRDALITFLVPWVLLPIGLLILLQVLAPYTPGVRTFLKALDVNDPAASFALVILNVVGSFALIGYYLRKYKAKISSLGIREFSLGRAIVYIFLILVSFGILVGIVYYVVQLVDPHFNAMQPQTNEFTSTHSSLSLWALVIIPPFVEETVFRGFMFPAFAKRYGTVIGAILASILFGFAHLQANVSVYTFILGLLLCALYVRMRSIIPGIALHMLNNYIAYMALSQK